MGQLEIQNLVKVYGSADSEIVAVNNLNISLEDGEFLVLVGPSGCGKSTTLRCVAGLENPTDGEILINNEPITDKQPKNRNLAMVFQNYALYPHMTARENMSFGLKMTTNLSEEEISEKVEWVAEMMGIQDLLEDKPGELSGGQQQRVALGRAIVREPEAFLMDEPLSNLDAKLRSIMRTELQDLQERLDTTTIYVTHDQTEAMTMGDRIAILDGGELQQIGTPLECYHQPNNKFVAGFIGSPSMNFLNVTKAGNVLEHSSFTYELSNEIASNIDHEELVLGIRPEDIDLQSKGRNQFTSTISVIEPMGDMTHLHLDFFGQQITATVDGDTFVKGGEDIKLTIPEDKIHLFDAATGKALKNRESDFKDESVLMGV